MRLLRRFGAKKSLSTTVGLLLLAFVVWVYYAYVLLLSPASLSALAGPQENYYWPVAQLQVATYKAKIALLLYADGRVDFSEVQRRFDVLESRYSILATPSDSTAIFQGNETSQRAIAAIGSVIESAKRELPGVRADRSRAIDVSVGLDKFSDPFDEIMESVSSVEIARRDEVYDDLIGKRHLFFLSGLLLMALLAGTGVLAIRLLRHRRRLRIQQAAAMEAERAAIQSKNAFLGMIGHELRTPLQSIISVTDTLLERSFPERDAALVRRLAVAAARLEAQMKDLTDFARLDAGVLQLREQEFQPSVLIDTMIEEAREAARRKHLTVRSELSDLGGWYLSDPDRIRQIMTNLISNAIRYTNEGGITVRACVSMSNNAPTLDIVVEDTGSGMPADSVERVFRPFTRLDEPGMKRIEGAGIGLAIVKGLVGLLQGSLRMETGIGEGTRVYVTIPIAIASSGNGNSEAALRDASSILGKRVLVVDDEDSARDSLADIVSSLGADVDIAANAQEALEALRESRYDAVLLDVQMPGEDGVQVAGKVRSGDGPNRDVPIIAVSAYFGEQLVIGDPPLFTKHLHKPVRKTVLRDALVEVCFGT
ncbi:hypothetical protein C0Z18_25185 [Trinickia dabaoshanensis]|uniref:histidine kinase n=1 Tax=Trinickia dabaoshanensis TaxID=564714 RepID=A0A2N7VFT5_9BURK|nr:hybrid sensor histidine kinase/response regulator [Trinickia dabaoshanensis]PMS16017.1 hypothetical protein C0Z18_25185 [Trinickia dabaoshanensis]